MCRQVGITDLSGDVEDDEDSACNNVCDDDSDAAIGDLVSRNLSTSKTVHVTLPGLTGHFRRVPPGDHEMAHENDSYWEAHAQKTFGHNTLETLPHADHYRNLLSTSGECRLEGRRHRPTLMELHEQEGQVSHYGVLGVPYTRRPFRALHRLVM